MYNVGQSMIAITGNKTPDTQNSTIHHLLIPITNYGTSKDTGSTNANGNFMK